MSNDERCCICGGLQSSMGDRSLHSCDECDAYMCPTCYAACDITYVTKVTRQGMIGYLVLCNKCKAQHITDTTINTNSTPFIN